MPYAPRPEYRLYLDETGDHTKPDGEDVGKRYLGLTGVVIHRETSRTFGVRLEDLKRRHFGYDPDEPPICLHRKEILKASGPFWGLRDEAKRRAFDDELFGALASLDFMVIAVVVDKRSHQEKEYRRIQQPYHYGLHALMERYCGWLRVKGATGDVMGEARGKTEDAQLRAAYTDFHDQGSSYCPAAQAKTRLTSRQMKLNGKDANVPGLQLADLLAHPLTRDVLVHAGVLDDRGGAFADRMCDLAEAKYNRQIYSGRIAGYGRKLLL